MLKDEQDCFYIDGGDARPLKTWSEYSSAQYVRSIYQIHMVKYKELNGQKLNKICSKQLSGL